MSEIASSLPNPRQWLLPTALAIGISASLLFYISRKAHEYDVPTSPFIVSSETAQSLEVISRAAYEARPFMVSVGERAIPFPYDMLAGKAIVERKIRFRCGGGEKRMTVRGASIGGSLDEFISGMQQGEHNAVQVTAADGLSMIIPKDAEILISASEQNDGGKHDTPYDVVAISDKVVYPLDRAVSVQPVQSTTFGPSSSNAALFSHVYTLSAILPRDMQEGERIPLRNLTAQSALLIAGDGWKRVINEDVLDGVYIVRHNGQYDVDAKDLGPSFHVKDVEQIGLQEPLPERDMVP
jgi:hypothetical protein